MTDRTQRIVNEIKAIAALSARAPHLATKPLANLITQHGKAAVQAAVDQLDREKAARQQR